MKTVRGGMKEGREGGKAGGIEERREEERKSRAGQMKVQGRDDSDGKRRKVRRSEIVREEENYAERKERGRGKRKEMKTGS